MRTLLLIPSYVKTNLAGDVATDNHPLMDYQALADAVQSAPGDHVELLDYAAVERDSRWAVRLARKVAGRNVALAVMAFLRRDDFDAIFTNAENVALPLAMLLKLSLDRPRHVTIAHRLSAKRKKPFYKWLKLHRQMDCIFVYAASQRDHAISEFGIPAESLRLISFHADHRFYRPLSQLRVEENQICSAGLEWRDYPTLIEAVAEQSDLQVKLAAASPWSKHTNEVEARELPKNVDARRYDYFGLRALYAQSAFVVVPLYENDFQAGVTTILEAMAMGKAVVATNTTGQTDVLIDERTGLYVAPGSPDEWRKAIDRLREDHALRARLGQAARNWIEENATLDRWVQQIMAGLNGDEFVAPAAGFGASAFAEPLSGVRSGLRESGVRLTTLVPDQDQAAEG